MKISAMFFKPWVGTLIPMFGLLEGTFWACCPPCLPTWSFVLQRCHFCGQWTSSLSMWIRHSPMYSRQLQALRLGSPTCQPTPCELAVVQPSFFVDLCLGYCICGVVGLGKVGLILSMSGCCLNTLLHERCWRSFLMLHSLRNCRL